MHFIVQCVYPEIYRLLQVEMYSQRGALDAVTSSFKQNFHGFGGKS